MKIYTRTGDRGATGLFGGERLQKSHPRLHAYGTVDELNACIGIALAEGEVPESTKKELEWVQHTLFQVGADLATPLSSAAKVHRIDATPTKMLEGWIDAMEVTLPPLTKFIFPSGSPTGCHLHLARTVCRRAERWIAELMEIDKLNHEVMIFMNRLSDYLFVVARFVNKHAGSSERTVEIQKD